MSLFEKARIALYMRDVKSFQSALSAGIDLQTVDAAEQTLLHTAAQTQDCPAIIDELIAAGAEINALDGNGETPLYRAVDSKHTGNVHALLRAGADANIVKASTNTNALFRAIYCNCPEIALVLLERTDDVNIEAADDGGTPLVWAVNTTSADLVRRLVERGANFRAPGILQAAAYRGRLEHIQYLLGLGLDINDRNGYGNTCLHTAANNGQLAVVVWLLEHGADPTLRGEEGLTALDVAVKKGHEDVVRVLRRATA